jgi:hypothetical protein
MGMVETLPLDLECIICRFVLYDDAFKEVSRLWFLRRFQFDW